MHGTSLLTLDDTARNPVWRQFTPFGAPRGTQTGTWPDVNGYLGDPVDASTGLTTVGAREYDSSIGRFLSIDPVLEASDPQELNGYGYSADNPVTADDPSGLCITNGDVCVYNQGPTGPVPITTTGGSTGGGTTTTVGTTGSSGGTGCSLCRIVVRKYYLAAGMPPWLQYNANHAAAVMGALNNIVPQLQAQGYSDAAILEGIQLEMYIRGASKRGIGPGGFADIAFRGNGPVLIWEVKAASYQGTAAAEALFYATRLSAQGTPAVPGFNMTGTEIMPAPGGEVRVYAGPPPGVGGILYDYVPNPPVSVPSPVEIWKPVFFAGLMLIGGFAIGILRGLGRGLGPDPDPIPVG